MKLFELFDQHELRAMLDAGYVRHQTHPTLPLSIYNYTEQAQFQKMWNSVTRQCRGLVIDHTTDEVIARPFRKFFNHGENADASAVLETDEEVTVSDKMDGSLGILFFYAGDWHVATRGSFASDQALHATKLFRRKYSYLPQSTGMTYLFEIIYPDNRIVVDYGHRDDLVLLGAVNIETGRSVGPHTARRLLDWRGPVTDVFTYRSLAEAIAAKPRPNAEGLVVHGLSSDERIKVKQEDYVRLHRIITGLSTRTVWEHLATKPLSSLLEPLPEEFHPWVISVANGLEAQAASTMAYAKTAHAQIIAELPEGFERKDYARKATQVDKPMRSYLFLILDGMVGEDRNWAGPGGKSLQRSIWRDIKPERETLAPGVAQHTEDTA